MIAQGRLSQRSYQAQDGSNRTVVELTVDEIGPSLRYATAQVNRQSSSTGFAGGSRASNAAGAGYAGGANYAASQAASQHAANSSAADPWSAAAPTNDSFSTFGANSDFGGDSEEPEF